MVETPLWIIIFASLLAGALFGAWMHSWLIFIGKKNILAKLSPADREAFKKVMDKF